MDAISLGARLAEWRRGAGLTQAALAARMGTKQPVISRVESGGCTPTLDFLERFARATGRTEIVLRFEPDSEEVRRRERRRRLKSVMGDYVFDPWARNPTPAEARSLLADGLTRERFERAAVADAR
jgi:transcriptional regulator with XRE-family HTH domain